MVYDRQLGEILIKRIGLCITGEEYQYEKLVADNVLPSDSALRMTISFVYDAITNQQMQTDQRTLIEQLLNQALSDDFPN